MYSYNKGRVSYFNQFKETVDVAKKEVVVEALFTKSSTVIYSISYTTTRQ